MDVSEGRYGTVDVQSTGKHRGRTYTDVKDLGVQLERSTVWIRARVQSSVIKDGLCFVVLRQHCKTVQMVVGVNDDGRISKQMVDFVANITKESVIDVYVTVIKTIIPVESCSVRDLELEVIEVWVLSAAKPELPFQLDDAAKPVNEDNPESQEVIDQETRLDNRVLDLRTPSNQAIFRIKAGVCRLFRDILHRQGFMEMFTPKLHEAGTAEDVDFSAPGFMFPVGYYKGFQGGVYLAATPQFHKQMAIAGDFDRVYTLEPNFRGDPPSHRHLTQFLTFELEMTIKHHYHEVVDLTGAMFNEVFRRLKEEYASEIEAVGKQYKAEPFQFLEPTLRLEYPQALQMLEEAGVTVNEDEELSMSNERLLGKLVKEKYKTDFLILDKFPLIVRPFYTVPDSFNPKLSNSFDILMRGEEVATGSQRIIDPKVLVERIKFINTYRPQRIRLNGIVQSHVDTFTMGCPPHAGCGIGVERVVMLFLGLDDIRKTTMFPRDATRIKP